MPEHGATFTDDEGREMKIVANRIPGNAKTTLIPNASVMAVSQPVLPNNRINMKPAMTGETANGMSTSPLRIRRPQNLSRTSTHAMQRPNTVLIAVAPTAIIKVSLSELTAASDDSSRTTAPKPSASAPQKIASSGASNKPAAYNNNGDQQHSTTWRGWARSTAGGTFFTR